MASKAPFAKQAWVGCPVLKTGAYAFVSEISTARGSRSCCSDKGWGTGDIAVGLSWCTESPLCKQGISIMQEPPGPGGGVKTLCEAGEAA